MDAVNAMVAAVRETGLGNTPDKTFKNRLASASTYPSFAGQQGGSRKKLRP